LVNWIAPQSDDEEDKDREPAVIREQGNRPMSASGGCGRGAIKRGSGLTPQFAGKKPDEDE
jgi:hypothetical protein